RIPVPRVEGREPEGRGVLRERDRLGALRHAPADLFNAGLDVPEGQQDQRDEPIRCRATPLVDREVVPRADAAPGEVLVLRAEEDGPGEPGKRRKAQLGLDTVEVHVGDARLWVIGAGPDLVEAGRLDAELFS